MALLRRGIVGGGTLDRVILTHGVVESTRVAIICDVCGRVDHHASLILAKDVANWRQKEAIDEAIDPAR